MPAPQIRRDIEAPPRSGHARDVKDGVDRVAGQLPQRASRGLSGRRGHGHVSALVPTPRAGCARSRLRRRDLYRGSWPTCGGRATAEATRSASPASRRPTTSTCAAGPGLQLRVDSLGQPIGPSDPSRGIRATRRLTTLDLELQEAAERRCARDRTRANARSAAGTSNGGAIVALDPRDGAVRALASYPTYDPSLYVGRVRRARRIRRASRTERTAKAQLPRAQPRDRRRLSAGVDVQAGYRSRCDAGAPDLSRTTRSPARGRTRRTARCFKNWNPYVNEAMTLPTRSRAHATRTSTSSGTGSTDCRPSGATRLQEWASRFGFGTETGSSSAPRAPACCRRRSGARRRSRERPEIDKLWKPATRSSSLSARRTCLSTPMQLARFYAMVANGGRLVTPHLVGSMSSSRPTAPRPADGPAPPHAAAPAADRRRPQALSVVQRGLLLADPRPQRNGDVGVRRLPDRHRRQDGNGREGGRRARLVDRRARRPVLVVRLRAGRRRPSSSSARSSRTAVTAATRPPRPRSKVFQEYFGIKGAFSEIPELTSD